MVKPCLCNNYSSTCSWWSYSCHPATNSNGKYGRLRQCSPTINPVLILILLNGARANPCRTMTWWKAVMICLTFEIAIGDTSGSSSNEGLYIDGWCSFVCVWLHDMLLLTLIDVWWCPYHPYSGSRTSLFLYYAMYNMQRDIIHTWHETWNMIVYSRTWYMIHMTSWMHTT